MGIRIASQSELLVQKYMDITHVEDRIGDSMSQCSDSSLSIADPEVEVFISSKGREMFDFDENGKYGNYLSDEELIEKFGALPQEEETIKFQYGYDKEFDSVSSSFGDPFKRFLIGRYAGSGIDYKNIDYSILDKMLEKYSELKQDIEANYSDEEKEQRLSELDLAYETVFENNILHPIRAQIDSSMSFYNSGGTLTYIAGSQSFIDQYYASQGEMSAVYRKLDNVNNSLNSVFEREVSWWIANQVDIKNSLVNAISSMIDITGTAAQKQEYSSMKN